MRATAQTLRASLESTEKGLANFELSLRRSGMAEAEEGYRQLQSVLIQQRMWARRNHRVELTQLFQSVARRAESIHGILEPYVNLMAPLRQLDRLELPQNDSSRLQESTSQGSKPREQALETKVLQTVLMSGRASPKRLLKALDCGESEMESALRRLADQGTLRRRGWGRGLSFELTARVRERLMERLMENWSVKTGGRNG